jgi:putative secretion ATPase (PEP-CTERM system associated)
MYESFYGLTAKPFQIIPDPRFYFGSKQHRKAKAYLEYGLSHQEGFIVVTGEIGAGKTTLLRGLLASVDRERLCVAQLVTTQLNPQETLHMIAAGFGLQVTGRSKAEMLTTLEAFFLRRASERKRCLLVVDEAQNLGAPALEELRMLSNFQIDQHSLLQGFLVGQPELRETMRRPQMEQLRQRVTAACHIDLLDLEDTRLYIEHRLRCAGATDRPSFEPDCFEAVYRGSGGVPRRINLLCDRLLLQGYLTGTFHFTASDVDEVARELDAETRGVGLVHHEPPVEALPEAEATEQAIPWLNGQRFTVGERIERSLLRMERLSLRTLSLLQRMTGEVADRAGQLEHVPEDSHSDGPSPGVVTAPAAPAASAGDRQRHP